MFWDTLDLKNLRSLDAQNSHSPQFEVDVSCEMLIHKQM